MAEAAPWEIAIRVDTAHALSYSCRHGYAHRAHVICDLPPKVVAAAMGHSVQAHLAAYRRWCGDDVVDDAFTNARAKSGPARRVAQGPVPRFRLDRRAGLGWPWRIAC